MENSSTSKRILVIDDDITSLDLISYLFEERGYQVIRCSSGSQALEVLGRGAVALVLVDLMMPGLNGIETVREIRARGHLALPIIAFTAAEEPVLHEEAKAAGCAKVLCKPLRPKQLVAEIEAFL